MILVKILKRKLKKHFKLIFPEEPVGDISETSEQKKPEDRGFKIAVIAAVISCFIIIIMPIIYRLTQKHTNRNRTLLSVRYEEDDGNHPETKTENMI